MFVDESTSGDYLLMCALVSVQYVSRVRAVMKALLLPGQRSLHMQNERNRADKILADIVARTRVRSGATPTEAVTPRLSRSCWQSRSSSAAGPSTGSQSRRSTFRRPVSRALLSRKISRAARGSGALRSWAT